MPQNIEKFFSIVHNPVKFRLFLFRKLPAAFFSGVRVKYADHQKVIVTIPYRWFTANPFRSTYFACLSMAAEMSTGVLAMANCYGQQPPLSSLVVKAEGQFFKKAVGITTFTCEEGSMIRQAAEEAMASGKAITASVRSTGKDAGGDTVAEFVITWSFKSRSA